MQSVEEQSGNEEDGEGSQKENEKKTAGNFRPCKRGVSHATLFPGKTVHNLNYKDVHKSTINTVENHVKSMEMPRKIRLAKKKAAAAEKKAKLEAEKKEREEAEARGEKVPKKPRVNKFAFPTPEALPPPKPLSVADAMKAASSWQ